MRLNLNKTKSVIVSRSKIIFPHPDIFLGDTSLNSCDYFKICSVMFDSSFTFERHSVPFCHWLLKRLVYLENLLGSFWIRMSH